MLTTTLSERDSIIIIHPRCIKIDREKRSVEERKEERKKGREE